jgi:hypothetical protein
MLESLSSIIFVEEIFAWREKYKEMQSRLEVELKGFEDKRL